MTDFFTPPGFVHSDEMGPVPTDCFYYPLSLSNVQNGNNNTIKRNAQILARSLVIASEDKLRYFMVG